MSILFLASIILPYIGLGIAVVGKLQPDDDLARMLSRVGLTVAVGLGGLFALMASVTSVPAQSVGVAFSLGRPYREYGPGLHFKRPWATVIDVDGTKK